MTQEWIHQGQSIDHSRCPNVLRVEDLHPTTQTGGHQEGVPDGERVASPEGLRFWPEVGDGKENDVGQNPHRGQGRPGLRFRKAGRCKFSAGRDELATNLPRER